MSYQPPPTCALAQHGFQAPLLVVRRPQGPTFNNRVNQMSPRQNRVMSPQARESWRAQPEAIGHPLQGTADTRRQIQNRNAASAASSVRGTRSFEPPRRDLVMQGSSGRDHCGGEMPTANRGREVHMTSRRDVQNDNRRENGVPSIAYGVREPQLRSGRDLTGGADRSVGREPHASAG